jgi:DNA-nicking Smr family endonuclease
MRRTSEEERKLFKAVIDQARPVKKKAPAKTKPSAIAAAKAKLKAGGLDGGTQARLRRGALEPQARLDLHGHTQEAAHRALSSFLRGAQKRGCKLVLVITGKGARSASDAPFDMSGDRRGALKGAVPRWLNEAPFAALIASIGSAHRRHGGDGALYIYLRKNP